MQICNNTRKIDTYKLRFVTYDAKYSSLSDDLKGALGIVRAKE